MKALVFEKNFFRLAATKLLGTLSGGAFTGPLSPLRWLDIPEPTLPAPDWMLVETSLCGLCGSDYKQVFLDGAADNPMTSVISFPQVLGHEVVGTIVEVGAQVKGRRVGERIVLYPNLSCGMRGLTLCSWCEIGAFPLCLNVTHGNLPSGIHTGNCSTAIGGMAPIIPVHAQQCLGIPDGITDEAAVLSDPFGVSFHAILKAPPPPNGTVLVYGCGTLGLLAILILKRVFPRVRVLAVARFPHQAQFARQLGADDVWFHRPKVELIHRVGEATQSKVQTPWAGLPMLAGGVDVVYDTVASAETLEVGVRICRARGSLVIIGVGTPQRFEWTPIYYKELNLVGSNAFGVERFAGREQNAIDWYFEWLNEGPFDATSILTHRFPLHAFKKAFGACYRQGESRAVKVLFDHRFEHRVGEADVQSK
jgi:threonine dehydrogenase-like Zn-dependent dehydrogenase